MFDHSKRNKAGGNKKCLLVFEHNDSKIIFVCIYTILYEKEY